VAEIFERVPRATVEHEAVAVQKRSGVGRRLAARDFLHLAALEISVRAAAPQDNVPRHHHVHVIARDEPDVVAAVQRREVPLARR